MDTIKIDARDVNFCRGTISGKGIRLRRRGK